MYSNSKSRTFGVLREIDREFITEIMQEHKEAREDNHQFVKTSKETPNLKNDKKELSIEVSNRLMKTRQTYDGTEAELTLDDKLELAKLRAKDIASKSLHKNPKRSAQEIIARKNELSLKNQELANKMYNNRLERFKKNLDKIKEDYILKVRLNQERREKQIIKSKVEIALNNMVYRSCDRFWNDYQRFSNAIEIDLKKQNSNKKDTNKKVEEVELEEKPKEDPNEILLHTLTKEEISLVIFN